ncbi:MAG TPA: DUF305 domain-containing protein [Aldersonia sp.]
MKRLSILAVTLLVIAAATVGVLAWGNRDTDTYARMHPGMMAPGSGSAPEWWDDSWNSMMGWAGVKSEPEFLAEMVAHHQEAVTAARELTRSDRQEMQAFGESIVQIQSAQIQQMQAWLRDWCTRNSRRPSTTGR